MLERWFEPQGLATAGSAAYDSEVPPSAGGTVPAARGHLPAPRSGPGRPARGDGDPKLNMGHQVQTKTRSNGGRFRAQHPLAATLLRGLSGVLVKPIESFVLVEASGDFHDRANVLRPRGKTRQSP